MKEFFWQKSNSKTVENGYLLVFIVIFFQNKIPNWPDFISLCFIFLCVNLNVTWKSVWKVHQSRRNNMENWSGFSSILFVSRDFCPDSYSHASEVLFQSNLHPILSQNICFPFFLFILSQDVPFTGSFFAGCKFYNRDMKPWVDAFCTLTKWHCWHTKEHFWLIPWETIWGDSPPQFTQPGMN